MAREQSDPVKLRVFLHRPTMSIAGRVLLNVYAHNASCHKARHVARVYARGRTPRHWVCSASLAACYRHSFSSHHYVTFRRVPRHYGR